MYPADILTCTWKPYSVDIPMSFSFLFSLQFWSSFRCRIFSARPVPIAIFSAVHSLVSLSNKLAPTQVHHTSVVKPPLLQAVYLPRVSLHVTNIDRL